MTEWLEVSKDGSVVAKSPRGEDVEASSPPVLVDVPVKRVAGRGKGPEAAEPEARPEKKSSRPKSGEEGFAARF